MSENDKFHAHVDGNTWKISLLISTEHFRHLVQEIATEYPVNEEEAAKGLRLEISGPVTSQENQRKWLKEFERMEQEGRGSLATWWSYAVPSEPKAD